eukprot:scaffold288545_cov54-Attheya_sp.AAC.2
MRMRDMTFRIGCALPLLLVRGKATAARLAFSTPPLSSRCRYCLPQRSVGTTTTTTLPMALVPLPTDEREELLTVGAPTGEQYAT